MAVIKGACQIRTEGFHGEAGPGDVVLLDCYAPHAYSTTQGWEAYWLHFDGPQSREYVHTSPPRTETCCTPGISKESSTSCKSSTISFKAKRRWPSLGSL